MLLSYHAGATECMCFSIPFYVKGSLFISMGCPKYRKCAKEVSDHFAKSHHMGAMVPLSVKGSMFLWGGVAWTSMAEDVSF